MALKLIVTIRDQMAGAVFGQYQGLLTQLILNLQNVTLPTMPLGMGYC
jgi:hypothetical protein